MANPQNGGKESKVSLEFTNKTKKFSVNGAVVARRMENWGCAGCQNTHKHNFTYKVDGSFDDAAQQAMRVFLTILHRDEARVREAERHGVTARVLAYMVDMITFYKAHAALSPNMHSWLSAFEIKRDDLIATPDWCLVIYVLQGLRPEIHVRSVERHLQMNLSKVDLDRALQNIRGGVDSIPHRMSWIVKYRLAEIAKVRQDAIRKLLKAVHDPLDKLRRELKRNATSLHPRPQRDMIAYDATLSAWEDKLRAVGLFEAGPAGLKGMSIRSVADTLTGLKGPKNGESWMGDLFTREQLKKHVDNICPGLFDAFGTPLPES